MTGAFLRVKRGDSWEAIEVEHLTDEERKAHFIWRSPEELIRWMDLLSHKLAEAQGILDGLVADGVLRTGDDAEDGGNARSDS